MAQPARQMTLIAFLQAQNCSNLPGSWRHPASASDFLAPAYYQRIARTLEDACFHMAFFDDRLAIPDIYTGDHAETVEHGIRAVKLDPSIILAAMGAATTRLGLGATYSTTYYEPFHVARVFATLDLITAGRVAWNVVTSLNDSEALNFGRSEHLEHDLRYDRADEFMSVVLGHWSTWDEAALVVDKAGGLFAHAGGVRRLDHSGRYFKSRGPFTVPRSPQGHPVLLQAGQSGRGRAFAARWGEVIFVAYSDLESGCRQYAELKRAVAESGRDPAHVHIAPACYVIVGETAAIADEKRAVIEATARPIDALVLMSEVLNHDFSTKAPDEPFTDSELAAMSFHGFRDRVISLSGKRNPTPAEFARFSGRGTIAEHHVFCGTPAQVADEMEAWFTGGACDGFVCAATHMPGSYDDIARLLIPELQRRRLFRTDHGEDATLRGALGLPRPTARECAAMSAI